ncbi:MAG: hypothetical protein EOO52_09020 [Gammaproteobacteria bacterium]|nr:MAG: hypothetical protein EOO52_09020 [Gammaproteobacteria bacterium]
MLKIFLPVLFPSWRFFSSIGPSPRIHIAFSNNENDEPTHWREFRPLPRKISFREGIFHLFHNPRWNETLYINSCAERLFEVYSELREQEIMYRILEAIKSEEIIPNTDSTYVKFRISAVIREAQIITQPVTFVSKAIGFGAAG